MSMEVFLASLIGRIYKILPLFEDTSRGDEVFVGEYIDSLLMELKGATRTFPRLGRSPKYINIVNTVHYMNACLEKVTLFQCRREIFKMIAFVEDMKGGDFGA